MKTVQGRRHTGILDPTGCYNKTLPTMPFINHTHLFLTILKARKSKLQATVIGCLPYTYTKLYSCNLQHSRRVKATPQGPLYKGANPVMRVLPPGLIGSHQYITFGFQYTDLETHSNIQTLSCREEHLTGFENRLGKISVETDSQASLQKHQDFIQTNWINAPEARKLST